MIVAGFGFRNIATTDSLRNALAATRAEPPALLAVPADKAHAPAIQQLARELGLAVLPVAESTLRAMQTQTQSQPSLDHRATGSVAEACALAAAGPDARLLKSRQISADRCATCAIAQTSIQGTPT